MTARYAEGVKMIFAGGHSEVCNGASGTKWIGDEGYVHVDRGFLDATPKVY